MRWLSKYPITAHEVREILESIPQVNPPGTPPAELRIGGINDLIRRLLLAYFEDEEHMALLLSYMAGENL